MKVTDVMLLLLPFPTGINQNVERLKCLVDSVCSQSDIYNNPGISGDFFYGAGYIERRYLSLSLRHYPEFVRGSTGGGISSRSL
jgi:hypothetical protein